MSFYELIPSPGRKAICFSTALGKNVFLLICFFCLATTLPAQTKGEVKTMAGSCASPDGSFKDQPGICNCTASGCGSDCVTCVGGVSCTNCPCRVSATYATANANGQCYNNLASGTHCYTYIQPGANVIYMRLIFNNCASCSGSGTVGGGYSASNSANATCTKTYDKNCAEISATAALSGSGHAGINVGDRVTVCFTVPGACSGTMDICPIIRCSSNATTSTCGSEALPVRLLHFSTQRSDDFVELSWKTASEVNNDFFTIQRTKDGKHFEILTTVKGSGNSSTEKSYAYYDQNPHKDRYYYRLIQTDFDGKTEYLGMSAVNPEKDNHKKLEIISLFPNPAAGANKINYTLFNHKEGLVTTQLYNLTGEQVLSTEEFTDVGIVQQEIDISLLSDGPYVIKITSRDGTYISRSFKK